MPLSMLNLFDISSQLLVVDKRGLALVLVYTYNCTTLLSDIRRAKKDDEKRISSVLSYYFDIRKGFRRAIGKRSMAFLQCITNKQSALLVRFERELG